MRAQSLRLLFRGRDLLPGATAPIALTSSSQGGGDKVSALRDRISMQPGEKAGSGVLEVWDLLGPRPPEPSPWTSLFLSKGN